MLFPTILNKKMEDFDSIQVRNDLINKYKPQECTIPYSKEGFELVSPIGEENRKDLIKTFTDLPIDQAVSICKTSDSLAEVIEKASEYGALERVYQGPFEDPLRESKKYLFARLFLDNIVNAMGPRNRMRIVKKEIVSFVKEKRRQGRSNITILSIGCGSARAILEAVSSLEEHGKGLNLLLVDPDPFALEFAKKLADQKIVNSRLELIKANFVQYIKNNREKEKIDFIEIVGLCDYLKDKHIQFLLFNIKDYLRKDGKVLFSNIADNDEKRFLHTVVGWPQMIYRTKEQLLQLSYYGGFKKVNLIREPIGVYNFIKAEI